MTSCVALYARLDFSDFSETFRSALIILDFPACLKTACFSLLLKHPVAFSRGQDESAVVVSVSSRTCGRYQCLL